MDPGGPATHVTVSGGDDAVGAVPERRSHPAAFVGRTAELTTLAGLLGGVAEGRPATALVQGPAGIGKTALVRHFLVAAAGGTRSAWLSGDSGESLLSFGIVDQLWSAVGRERPSRALPTVDHLGVGAELLELFSDVATDDPVVLVVDDVQWADGPSVQAFVFAVRRLVAERLLIVFTCRDDELAGLPDSLRRVLGDDRCTRLDVSGLDRAELGSLAVAVGGPTLPLHAAGRLRDQTDGNPLHALALIDELPADQLVGPDTGPLPAPRSYAALVSRRLASCSPEAVAMAEAASILGMRSRVGAVAALCRAKDPGPPLDELVTAGVLVLAPPGDELCFSHPLVQATVYHELAPGRRAAMHHDAAAAATTEADAFRHRIAATIGTDSDVADDVASFAARETERGAWSSAAHAYLAASRLHDDLRAQEGFLMLGAECLMFAGDGSRAAALLPRIMESAPCAKRDQLLGFVALVTGDRAGSQRLLERAWAQCEQPRDSAVAAKIASQLSMVSLNEGRASDAIDWARRSLSFGTPVADRGITRAVLATAHGELGWFERGFADIGDLPDDPERFDSEQLGRLLGRGVLHLFSEGTEAAVADLTLADEVGRRGVGPFSLRINALFHLADAEYRLGRWDRATLHAELATSLSVDTNAVWTLGLAHAVAAFPAAGRGEWQRAEDHIRAAESAADAHGDAATRVWVSVARARVAQARGDHAGVVDAVGAILALDDPDGLDEPGVQPWRILHGEALVGLGELDAAGALAGEELERGAARGNAGAMGRACRIRGLVAAARRDRAGAEEAFEAGLAHRGPGDRSLEDALLLLDYGSMLRRAAARRAAVERLAEARTILVGLVATPFLERCERELAACGGAVGRAADSFQKGLTAQELAVATLVASGMTNREVAAELVVSLKTVEYHLGNVFRKLDVTSRSMLTARVHREGIAGTTGGGAQPA